MSLSTPNYSFYAVPAMWALSVTNHFIAISLFNKHKTASVPAWDNSEPKDQFTDAKFKAALIKPSVASMIRRAEAANSNGFENIGFFGAAVVAGNVAGLSSSTLNTYAGAYLATRVLYSAAYILISSDSLSQLRSVLYLSGVGCCFTLFVKAGNMASKTLL